MTAPYLSSDRQLNSEEKKMKSERFVFVFCMAVVICWIDVNYIQGVPYAGLDQDKANEAKKLFMETNIALSEQRYDDAHSIAEKLITNYAGDYQIDLYLHFYVHTFYFLDEDFQKGMLHPTPPGMQNRINELKTKQNKTVIDLVKLVWVGNGTGGNFSTEYLQEILNKFPGSVWRDWAEWMLIQETEYRPREKYQDKSPEERSKLIMRDLYYAGKKFINDHPDSYMLPRLLKATAGWACSSGNTTTKEEAVQMCRRVLKDYPNAEYACARARQMLRELLGNEYKEPAGRTAEQDRRITLFYCQKPEISEYKKNTAKYVQMIEETQAETGKEGTKPISPVTTGTGLPAAAYAVIVIVIIIVGVGSILLLKKKASSRSK
jgi:hypothetical protein